MRAACWWALPIRERPAQRSLYENRAQYVEAMEKAEQGDAVNTILNMIDEAAAGRL